MNNKITIRTKPIDREVSIIVIEKNGFKVDEKECSEETGREYIKLDSDYKVDVEFALKNHFDKFKQDNVV